MHSCSHRIVLGTIVSLISIGVRCQLVWDAGKYRIYRDSVVQGKFVASALSSKELSSNYTSPANEFKSPVISFKFSINGKDNEMKPGMDHSIVIAPNTNEAETPLIKFGTQYKSNIPVRGYLAPNTKLKIRLDMRDVIQSLNSQGFYTTVQGDRIYKNDFKGVYVAGSSAPLIWDFDNLVNHAQLQLKDPDGDGIYELTLVLNKPEEKSQTASHWELKKDLSAFPAYRSDYPISDVLYNLGVDEMINAVEKDSTFRTGKEWAGVWTRDISYSIILSMAYLEPRVARFSLLRKVNGRKIIIQDTGTGGAWPISTDRMIWAVAAWELYKTTGDRDWLEEAYTIVKNSIDADSQTAYDPQTGLVKGESSFLDWREQTYPRWMQPVDIGESECLGTNAVHYEANVVLSKMATILGHKTEAATYLAAANKIRKGINTYLWMPSKQFYGQFLYGRNYLSLSPRSEALGEALCVLFGIAEGKQVEQVVSHTPQTDYGISCIFPQIPDIPPYHNNAVWPFVQTYWLWAAAKAGNEKAVMESIAAIYRPVALFLTNKENFVADNGDFLGTQINSSNMLWSLSGNISIVHKVLFGIRFEDNELLFQPFVPEPLKGKRSLTNLKYRDAVLDIDMEGWGNSIANITLDGKTLAKASIPSNTKGHHQVHIFLAHKSAHTGNLNKQANKTSLPAPELYYQKPGLYWKPIANALSYRILKNGKSIASVQKPGYNINPEGYAEYQLIAIDKNGIESFASEPLAVVADSLVAIFESENNQDISGLQYAGFSGKGFTEINATKNEQLSIPVLVNQEGTYAIDFRYANGNGPTNTENKCAIRTLLVDGSPVGTSLFPQRGRDEWSNWGFSNACKVKLAPGKHLVTLQLNQWNENMNGGTNQAMIDYVRLVRINND